ncbi:hypothetical protein TNCV_3314581 [Trichonephila clavipes]|nr:hypothetical protein TNCV_3314581 [Trichonephila clavipes]
MSSSLVPLKIRREDDPMHVKSLEAETSTQRWGVEVRRGVSAQVSSSLLDPGLKRRGPPPKALDFLITCCGAKFCGRGSTRGRRFRVMGFTPCGDADGH